METAESATATLHRNVTSHLQKMGEKPVAVPAQEAKIPLTEDLKQLGVDASYVAGATFNDIVGGAPTHGRETASRNPLKIAKERAAHFFRKKK